MMVPHQDDVDHSKHKQVFPLSPIQFYINITHKHLKTRPK